MRPRSPARGTSSPNSPKNCCGGCWGGPPGKIEAMVLICRETGAVKGERHTTHEEKRGGESLNPSGPKSSFLPYEVQRDNLFGKDVPKGKLGVQQRKSKLDESTRPHNSRNENQPKEAVVWTRSESFGLIFWYPKLHKNSLTKLPARICTRRPTKVEFLHVHLSLSLSQR